LTYCWDTHPVHQSCAIFGCFS